MPKLLQINVTSNWGSTGTIAEECNRIARSRGWETYFAFGRYYNSSKSSVIVGPNPQWDVYEHFIESCFLDNEGLASRGATKYLVKRIMNIQPDIVHLHNIHDHWLNIQILFEYLNQTNIKVVWTFHDFWAITGHCAHFVRFNCDKFKSECRDCPCCKGKILPLIKRTNRNFYLKKRFFSKNRCLTIVPVSNWVAKSVRQSFLKDKEIRVIPNGVDTQVFKPTEGFNHPKIRQDTFVIMAVSSQWKSPSKGLDDYIALSRLLKQDETIVLVGLPKDKLDSLPNNIIGIERTNSQHELATLYTRANVICSFSRAETFGLSIIEGYACGVPAVVYDNTAPPALITPDTGFVVPNKDYKAAYNAIEVIKENGRAYYKDFCIHLARTQFAKEVCFNKYMELYEELLSPKQM